MRRAAPLLPAWLRHELAPRRGRWRAALALSASATTALIAALTLQFATFPAPLMAFKSLLPSVVCTWRLLVIRLAVIAAGGTLGFACAGFAVQVPWLLIPGFFVATTAITYLVPIRQNPVAGYCLALTLAAVTYMGVLRPQTLGLTALNISVGFAIGVVVATLFARVRAVPTARDRLTAALSESFLTIRQRLRAAGARFRAGPSAPIGDDVQPLSGLAQHLQLLSLVRMEHLDLELERACVALITAGERAATFAGIADTAARRDVGHTMRGLLDAEIGALLGAIDGALERFARAARDPEHVIVHADPQLDHAWPDFDTLVADLGRREKALAAQGAVTGVALEESSNLHSFAQALIGLTDVLHRPPEALEHFPPEGGARPAASVFPPFDRFAAQFAMKIGLACTLALIVGIVSHEPEMETVVLNPLILIQGSYGATVRKAGLRLAGVAIGGLLAILTVITVMPNAGDMTTWIVVFFAVLLPWAYVALGSPKLSYFGVQVAATYMIIMVANGPVVDVQVALWRFFGTLVGAALLLGVFQVVAPDYAGRQIVSRFAELLRNLLLALPVPGRPLPAASRTRALHDRITAGLADMLRLADEARIEGPASGVDPEATVEAAGLLRRITYRFALLRHARRSSPRPLLSPAVEAALAVIEVGLRERLERLVSILEARHHRARTGSRRHRAAENATRLAAARSPAAIDSAWQTFRQGVEDARRAEMFGWSQPAIQALLAEVSHWQRIIELLPKLESELLRAILPEPVGDARSLPAEAQMNTEPPPTPPMNTERPEAI